MVQIIVSFPDDLGSQAEAAAQQRGVPIDEFVRQCVVATMNKDRSQDPFFADTALYRGDAPSDLSARHDDYLYGEDQ